MSKIVATKNQNGMSSVEIQQTSLRSFSECINCPHCGKIGFSRTETKMNLCNFLCCYCTGGCWMCHQILKRKDLNCYDAKHTCAECGKEVANYSAC